MERLKSLIIVLDIEEETKYAQDPLKDLHHSELETPYWELPKEIEKHLNTSREVYGVVGKRERPQVRIVGKEEDIRSESITA
jgi:hypothetical protein